MQTHLGREKPKKIDELEKANITRLDKNLEFVKQLRDKAKQFKMESVGVKSLDDVVIMYTSRRHVSRRELYCKLPHKNNFYIVEYEHTSPGRIIVTNYYATKITPELDEKIAIVKVDYMNVVEKILIAELRNIRNKKHDRANTLVVDNPHMFNKRVEPIFKEMQKPIIVNKNIHGLNQYVKQYSILTYMHGEWYDITYRHVKKGTIHIDKYVKSDQTAIHLQKVGVVSIDTFYIQLWGTRGGKYENSEGTIIETEVKEYFIENSDSLI